MPVIPSTGSAKARVGYRALAYTAFAGGSAHVDPAFPVSRMADLRNWRRSTRTSDIDSAIIAIDFGADTAVAAFSLELLNFPVLEIQAAHAATPTVWDPIAHVDCGSVDAEDGRRKALVVTVDADAEAYVPFTHRYARLLLPNDLDAGEDFHKIGNLGAWGELVSLYKNPGTPYRKVLDDTYDGSTSPTRVRLTFPARVERSALASVEQFLAMARAPRERVMLWDENEGDLTKWYHVQRSGVVTTGRVQGPMLDLDGFELTEVESSDSDR